MLSLPALKKEEGRLMSPNALSADRLYIDKSFLVLFFKKELLPS
jgi:hypothetical protein